MILNGLFKNLDLIGFIFENQTKGTCQQGTRDVRVCEWHQSDQARVAMQAETISLLECLRRLAPD